MNKKLGVIIPYRHRIEHLNVFQRSIVEYLNRRDIQHEIIIVNQDDSKQFNRGMLLNIGYKYAKSLKCDYVVFHDVDLVPISVDYSYSEYPIHLATSKMDEKSGEISKPFDQYFGGVTMFPIRDFKKINGYSNKYWGWGFEDDDLFLRCERKDFPTDEISLKNMRINHQSLFFNGEDSFVRAKNNIDISKDLTIFASFFPSELLYDWEKDLDIFTVFSLPGYDTAISYNSFKRYNFITFDDRENPFYVNSGIKTNYLTNVCVTLDSKNKKIKFYQDGEFIGEASGYKKLRSYEKERYFFIGAGDPKRKGDPNFFKGYIDSFAVIEEVISEDEIKKISLSYNFSKYKGSSLKVHYDSEKIENYKLVDLSGNGNDGSIFKCEIKKVNIPQFKKIKIPKRRESLFKSLKHEESGFFENKWKDKATRWNQLRFHNEVCNETSEPFESDGISNLKYTKWGIEKVENITKITVGIG
jgi:hypothetical protein